MEIDCWTTGCQLNTWAVVGCGQYDRTERNKIGCPGGYQYECCTRNAKASGSNSGDTLCLLFFKIENRKLIFVHDVSNKKLAYSTTFYVKK